MAVSVAQILRNFTEKKIPINRCRYIIFIKWLPKIDLLGVDCNSDE